MQKNLLDYLDKSIEKFPTKVCFFDGNNKYTFKEFGEKAKSLAMGLIEATNKPIVVLVDRNVESLAAMMAVLYSGNFYVPLDCKMPKQRLDSVFEKVKPYAIICSLKDKEIVKGLNQKIVFYDDETLIKYDEKVLNVKREKILDIDPAYVIFTSGSTGTPKGIVVSHISVIDFVEWMSDKCDISKKCIFANQAPFYFDLSVKDIYLTLKCGASCYILSRKELAFPMTLINTLNNKKVNSLIWATSAFNLIANSRVLDKHKPKYLKKVILGGEALLAKKLNIWRKALPKAQYINLYGPTEVTVDCTYYMIDREFNDDEEIPIGKACENKEVILLNEELKEVEIGEVGEICVRGVGLAKGYYNDAEKTEKVFIQNPNNPHYSDIIYKTGDLGVKNSDGLIFFKARKDAQIKHMGYRIELGEVEVAVNSAKEIDSAVCFYDDIDKKIVCVYSGDISNTELIEYLKNILPKYMIPNVYKQVNKLLYNANGKIDRVKHKEIYMDEKNK